MKANSKDKVVLYHKSCKDGFAAAYAAWLFLGSEAQYIPVQYGDEVPDIRDAELYILDFSYDRDTLLKLKDNNESILVLDHHKTAQKELEGLDFCRFDMSRSGAMLAWEFFHPGRDRPRLFMFIEDRDLWAWKLNFTKEIAAALDSYPMKFEVWNEFMCEIGLERLTEEGKAISRFIDVQVKQAVKQAEIKKFFGYEVPVVNATLFTSEIGNALASPYPFAVIFFTKSNGETVYSLRSDAGDPDCVDVGALCKELKDRGAATSGGGHKNAGGCVLADGVDYTKETLDSIGKTIKVVISSEGSFNLSSEGYQELIKRGWPVLDRDDWKKKGKPVRALVKHFFHGQEFVDFPNRFKTKMRSHPDVVSVVEGLGEKANDHNTLEVIEIPANIGWHIRDFMGEEYVAEDHRNWFAPDDDKW